MKKKDQMINAQAQKTNQSGSLSDTYTKDEADKKFNESSDRLNEANEKLVETTEKIKKIDQTLYAVVLILLVMVGTLIIDSFHINSVTYKEYSQKTDSVDVVQKSNEILLKQIQDLSAQNRQNSETIKQLLNK